MVLFHNRDHIDTLRKSKKKLNKVKQSREAIETCLRQKASSHFGHSQWSSKCLVKLCLFVYECVLRSNEVERNKFVETERLGPNDGETNTFLLNFLLQLPHAREHISVVLSAWVVYLLISTLYTYRHKNHPNRLKRYTTVVCLGARREATGTLLPAPDSNRCSPSFNDARLSIAGTLMKVLVMVCLVFHRRI
eukprot:TRINITY_DN2928_c0_g1_i2.p1 TRINITY_DN2928_c0_g1~~TRINITY_DN2928_c0_g1_i2.p1  ORF type:complete len:192 (+),score=0.14 TRINITY_DN2928_c0_g1_i2:410-985(+)